MPRNIRSLSLAPLVATTPPCAHSTAQLPTAMSPCPPPLADRSPVPVQQTSTVFRQGLITPTTPCYFLPKITTSSSSNDTSSNTTTTTAITITTTTTTTSTAIQTDHQQPRSVAMPACPLDADRTPESPDAGDDTDCDCSFSFEDFEKRYVPLSHLPTPPHLLACVAIDSRAPQGPVNTEFWGPAKYLASMIPRNASRQSPSTAVLAGILQRAGLRLGVVSLACCVLDCLSDRFLRQWRRLCLGHDSCPERSELLAICALAVSMKFMEDSPYSAGTWTRGICEGLFNLQALNLTERLVLDDLNYCLLGISTPQLLDHNLAEIRRCTQDAGDPAGEGSGYLKAAAFPLSEC